MSEKFSEFIPLKLCVLTVSDTRTLDTDTSGKKLVELLQSAGHALHEHAICIDDIYKIREKLSEWIASNDTHAVVITGGTGFAGRDSTPEAVIPLFDKSIDGFGELFRQVSYEEIGTSTIQSRAVAGLANYTAIFCLPGSTGACNTGWTKIIEAQLCSTTKPCNFVGQLLRRAPIH